MPLSMEDPIGRAKCSLEGLSVGDAFGETFFVNPDLGITPRRDGAGARRLCQIFFGIE